MRRAQVYRRDAPGHVEAESRTNTESDFTLLERGPRARPDAGPHRGLHRRGHALLRGDEAAALRARAAVRPSRGFPGADDARARARARAARAARPDVPRLPERRLRRAARRSSRESDSATGAVAAMPSISSTPTPGGDPDQPDRARGAAARERHQVAARRSGCAAAPWAEKKRRSRRTAAEFESKSFSNRFLEVHRRPQEDVTTEGVVGLRVGVAVAGRANRAADRRIVVQHVVDTERDRRPSP